MAKKTSIQVDVTGDARSAIKALGQVTKQMGTMQQKAVAVGSAIGSVLGKGITTAISAVKDLGGEILAQSDSVQKFQQTMSFAGFDTSAISEATKATKEYADQTVYDLTTVQNTTAQLAANGVQDYVGLTKAAGNLNAVAGGNAQTFKSVAMTLTQTAGAGKLTTENWNQLTDAIPGAAGRLMSAMQEAGAYTGNFRDAMAEGQITADEFNQALMSLGMSDVAQEAATSTATFEGAWGNMMASVTGGLAGLVNIVKPAITGSIGWAANQIGTWMSAATNAVQGFVDGITGSGAIQAAGKAFDAIVNAVKTAGDAIGSVAQTIVPALGQIGGASNIGQAVGQAFNGVAGIVQQVANAVTAFGDWVKANAEPISAGIVAISSGFAAWKVAGVITTVVNALKSFNAVSTIAAAKQWLLNAAMNANPIMIVVTAIGALVGALTWFFTQTETGRQIWSSFTQFLGSCVQGIIGFFQQLPGMIGGFFQSAAQFAQTAWSGITGFFSGIWTAITTTASNAATMIGGFLQSAFTFVQVVWSGITGFFSGIWNTVTSVVSAAGSSIGSLLQAAYSTVSGVWSGITGFFSGIWNTVTSAASAAGGAIGGFLQAAASTVRGIWSGITGFFSGIWNGIVSGVQGAVSGISGAFTGAINAVKGAFNGLVSFVQGIWNTISGIINTVKNAVGGAVSAVTGLFGRSAPAPQAMSMASFTPAVASFTGVRSISPMTADMPTRTALTVGRAGTPRLEADRLLRGLKATSMRSPQVRVTNIRVDVKVDPFTDPRRVGKEIRKALAAYERPLS